MRSRFLRACRRQPVDATPVWFMRQAGRWLRDYRILRGRHPYEELCRTPELAVEVSLLPTRLLDVDAALLFTDILLPLAVMGVPVTFGDGEGPHFPRPLRTPADLDALQVVDPREEMRWLFDALALLRTELAGGLPVIGSVAGPFTLAAYAIEGGPADGFARTKALMYGDPQAWHRLCGACAEMAARLVVAQADAGADAIHVFESWASALGEADYREGVLPHAQRVFEAARATGVVSLHYASGGAALLDVLPEAGGDVIGVDWRVPIDEAWERIGYDRAIQGNLDPTLLLGPLERLLMGAADVLHRASGRPGHIFSLGHGVLPSTSLDHLQALTRYVHAFGV